MSKTVRMSDIGARLHVSTVTVSKALSGQKGVSDEMREKIIRLADEMGYERKFLEENNKRKSNYIVGVIAAERYLQEKESFYWSLYQEILKRAIARNCFSVLEVIGYEMEQKSEMPKVVSENKVDGVIIMGAFHKEYVSFLQKNIHLPILNLDTTNGWENCDCVVSNNVLGGYQMTNYLFELGHTKIGFVGTRLATNSIDDRFLGYMKSLMEHGIKYEEKWVVEDRDREFGTVESEDGFRLPDDMPTAFFCNCDRSADILIDKLEQKGYSVPEDVSVVGFDNYISRKNRDMGITTYEIDIREMARRAIHIMVHKLENSDYSTGVFMIAGSFVERDSARRIAEPIPFI